jgi:hypothetical protein
MERPIVVYLILYLILFQAAVLVVLASTATTALTPLVGPASAPLAVAEEQRIHISGGRRRVGCDVPCYWPEHSHGILRRLRIDELDTELLMSMEGEVYYPALRLQHRNAHRAIASTRFDSDIPMPYFSFAEYSIQAAPMPFDAVTKAALFVARNCHSRSGREAFVRALTEVVRVDAPSACLHNVDLPAALRRDKHRMMRSYAFYLAFENQRVDDYVTEKLWGALAAGTIPVYLGAPNVAAHVPNGSIVHADDFATPRALGEHLRRVLADRALFDSYHAWRRKPLPAWFLRKYNFTRTHSECRTCQWARARLRNPARSMPPPAPPRASFLCLVNPSGRAANRVCQIANALRRVAPRAGHAATAWYVRLAEPYRAFFDDDTADRWFEAHPRIALSDGPCDETLQGWDALIAALRDPAETAVAVRELRFAPEVLATARAALVAANTTLSVHRRHLEGDCRAKSKDAALRWCLRADADVDYAAWCDLTHATLPAELRLMHHNSLLFTDGQRPALDRTFPRRDSHPFRIQVAMMTLAAHHVGNPASSIDFLVAAWRSHLRVHPRSCFSLEGGTSTGAAADTAISLAAVLVFRVFDGDLLHFGPSEIDQWLAYMRFAGVERVYMYDNCVAESECQERYRNRTEAVTYNRHPGAYMTAPSTPGGQIRAYEHFCRHYGHGHTHAFFGDLDEYPFRPHDVGPAFLRRYVDAHRDEAQLLLHSFFFTGPSEGNHTARAMRYTHRSAEPATTRAKPIVALRAMARCVVRNVHRFEVVGGSRAVDVAELHLRHYWCERGGPGAVADRRIAAVFSHPEFVGRVFS